MRSFVVIDIETTGFSKTGDEIIQIGAVKVKEGLMVGTYETNVKPIRYIPKKITELTGIKQSDVEGARVIEEVLPEFYDFCEGLPLVAHNLTFDYGFLREKGKKQGLDFSRGCSQKGVCTLKLSRKLYPHLKKHSLTTMVEEHKLEVDSTRLHSALYDAKLCTQLYCSILRESPEYEYLKEGTLLEEKEEKQKPIKTLSFK